LQVTMGDNIVDALIGTLCRSWRLFLTQGVMSIVLGVVGLMWPSHAQFTLIILLGLVILLNGIFAIFAAFGAADNHEPWAWQRAKGIIGIVAGVAALQWQGITLLVIVFLVGAWALITGIMDILEAIVDYQEITDAWLVLLIGFISLLFGIALFTQPAPANLPAIAYVFGVYAIMYGLVTCLIAFRMRTLREQPVEPVGQQEAVGTVD